MAEPLSNCPDAYTLAEALAQRCEGAHPYKDEWRARCPNHQGKSDTSLSLTPQVDRVLVHCHGGCPQHDVVRALGLSLADLFVPQPSAASNGHKRIVKVYEYYDVNGHLVHETVRYEPKDFRQRRPDPAKPGEYIWNLNGIEPVLYHLPQMRAAVQRGEPIYLVEGEKDAESLQGLGVTATCNPMGAGKWRHSYSEALRGAHVVILPDHDEPGKRHAQRVARALDGIAATTKIVLGLHTDAPGSDMSDWLAAGGTRAALEAAVAQTPWYTVPEAQTTVDTQAQHQAQGPLPREPLSFAPALLSFQELLTLNIPERKRYVEWLPERGLVMVYGPRGAGKTMLMLGLTLGLTTGTAFLKWPVHHATGVLYVDGEMPIVELRERTVALAHDAIPQHLHFLTGELVYEKLGVDLILTSEAARMAIEDILDANPCIRVVILDNISCLFSGISEDKKQDWEPINTWLVRLRHRGITVVLVHHAGKGGQQRGTSGREDSLDVVLSIEYPQDHRPEDGCHFHLRFKKSRSIKGDAVAALDVRLEDMEDGPTWTSRPLEESARERVEQMLNDGMTPGEIVAELDVTRSYVYRIRRDLKKTQETQS